MKATKEASLTDLRRKTSELVRPVIAGKGNVVITDHGEPVLEISRAARKPDRKKVLEILRRLGPLDIPPRK